MSIAGAGRDVPAAPRLSGAIRAAGTDFLANSWRLVVPNLAWGIGLVLLLAGVGISWAAWLLAPLLALPTVGVYRVAVLIVREEPVSISDGFASWRTYGARAIALAALLLAGVAVFATNLMTGIGTSGVVGWALATFAGWGLVATAMVASVVWPLLVDPWRASLGLRGVLRLGLMLVIAFPVRFAALTIVLGVLVACSTFAVVVILTMAIGLAALIGSRYVLPAADRFAPPPGRPGLVDT